MQYHALSLARDADRAVDVVCYSGTPPIDALSREGAVTMRHVVGCRWRWLTRVPLALALGTRVAAQSAHLFWILMTMPRCEEMLIQNPPCVPTFLVCGVACRARRTRLVVDWHNFAYTLFGMKRGAAERDDASAEVVRTDAGKAVGRRARVRDEGDG